jgi:chromosome segregation ATPase
VRSLRRPSAAAWLINRISAEDPKRVERLAKAAEALADAQRRVLDEEADPDELRSAAAAEREQIEGVVGEVRRVAGGGVNPTVLDRVTQTLRAVGADPELRGRVLRGRVEKEQTVATVGVPTSGPARPRRARRARTDARGVERVRKELARLRERLHAAEERRDRADGTVQDAAAELRQAKAELTEAKREARELARQVKEAERRAPD